MTIITHTYTVSHDPDGSGPMPAEEHTIVEVEYVPDEGEGVAETTFWLDGVEQDAPGTDVGGVPSPEALLPEGEVEIVGDVLTETNVLTSFEQLAAIVEAQPPPTNRDDDSTQIPLDLEGVVFDFDLDMNAARAAGLVAEGDRRWDWLFHEANLQGAVFNGAVIGVNFHEADLRGASFPNGVQGCWMQQTALADATIGPSSGNNFIGANLTDATLTGDWTRNNFLYASFDRTDLFDVTSLVDNSFSHADFATAQLADPQWYLDESFVGNSIFTGTGIDGLDERLDDVQINAPEVLAELEAQGGIDALLARGNDVFFEALDLALETVYPGSEGLDGRLGEQWASWLYAPNVGDEVVDGSLKFFFFDEIAGPHGSPEAYAEALELYGSPTLRFWFEFGDSPLAPLIVDTLVDMLNADTPMSLVDPYGGTRPWSTARELPVD